VSGGISNKTHKGWGAGGKVGRLQDEQNGVVVGCLAHTPFLRILARTPAHANTCSRTRTHMLPHAHPTPHTLTTPHAHTAHPPPGFLHAAFLSCDCRLERSNLFEDVCALVSKTSFPLAAKSLGALHRISLEALLAVLGALAGRCVVCVCVDACVSCLCCVCCVRGGAGTTFVQSIHSSHPTPLSPAGSTTCPRSCSRPPP
jgi:hypothetical protein